jgi:hypothetical protein
LTAEEALRARQEALARKQAAYRAVFCPDGTLSPAAHIVLSDLKKLSGFALKGGLVTTSPQGEGAIVDTNATIYRVAQQDMFVRILLMTDLIPIGDNIDG